MPMLQVESQVAGADALSAEDRAAITEALPAVSKSGSWIEACSSCLGASLSLLAGSELAHCRDCGLHDIAVGVRASLS